MRPPGAALMVIGAVLSCSKTVVLMSHNPLDACTSGPLMQTASVLLLKCYI